MKRLKPVENDQKRRMKQAHTAQAAYDKRLRETGKVRCGFCLSDYDEKDINEHLTACRGTGRRTDARQ